MRDFLFELFFDSLPALLFISTVATMIVFG